MGMPAGCALGPGGGGVWLSTWTMRKMLAMVLPQVGVVKDATMNGCTWLPNALRSSETELVGRRDDIDDPRCMKGR